MPVVFLQVALRQIVYPAAYQSQPALRPYKVVPQEHWTSTLGPDLAVLLVGSSCTETRPPWTLSWLIDSIHLTEITARDDRVWGRSASSSSIYSRTTTIPEHTLFCFIAHAPLHPLEPLLLLALSSITSTATIR